MRREWPEREAEVSNIIILYRNLLYSFQSLLFTVVIHRSEGVDKEIEGEDGGGEGEKEEGGTGRDREGGLVKHVTNVK